MSEKTPVETRREALRSVYAALLEKGYDPIRQIRGYLLSEDPTYIPDHRSARATIASIDRKDLLDDLLLLYFETLQSEASDLDQH